MERLRQLAVMHAVPDDPPTMTLPHEALKRQPLRSFHNLAWDYAVQLFVAWWGWINDGRFDQTALLVLLPATA